MLLPQTTLSWHFSWLFLQFNFLKKGFIGFPPFCHWSSARGEVKTQGNPVLVAAQWGAAALTHSAEDYNCFCQEKIKLPLPLGPSLPAPGFVPAEQSWGKSPGSMDHPQHWMSHSGAPGRKFPSSSPMVLKVFCNKITGRQQYPGAGMEFEPMAFWLGGETIPNWAKVTHT